MSNSAKRVRRRREVKFRRRVAEITQRLRQGEGLVFRELLGAEVVERLLLEVGYAGQERIYSPLVVLGVFLSQVLSADQSCRAAVARLNADRVAQELPPCSPETGAYCVARARLPEELFSKLVRTTGEQLQAAAPAAWLVQGRPVKLVDGVTVTMPDTAENQAEYPQPSSQEPGLGFPIARMVVIFSLAVGAVLDYAVGPYAGKKTGENQLFRGWMDGLSKDDVVVADRYYASYWDFALLEQRGVDLVTRLHQMRRADFRRGTRLGTDDHLVAYEKPQRPYWMDQATYDSLPNEIVLREVKVRVRIPGCRVRDYVLVTSLFDPEKFSAAELAALYRERWQVELDLRSLKSTMHMDHLRCLTPALVRKEIAMHLTAYNLVRHLMAEAAALTDQAPRQLSFQGALQTLTAHRDRGLLDGGYHLETHAALLASVATHTVGHRPHRVEPRAVKRRRKCRFLTVPRPQAKTRLLKRRSAD